MTQLGNPRPPSHWQDRWRESYDFASQTATFTWILDEVQGRTIDLTKVMLSVPAGLAVNASNYANFEILKNGATVMANWSTQTGQQGTITASTPVFMTLSATAANRAANNTDVISFSIVITGVLTVPVGRVVLAGYEI